MFNEYEISLNGDPIQNSIIRNFDGRKTYFIHKINDIVERWGAIIILNERNFDLNRRRPSESTCGAFKDIYFGPLNVDLDEEITAWEVLGDKIQCAGFEGMFPSRSV